MLSNSLHIAFITYARKPRATKDDALLADYLVNRGHRVETVPWDQPGSAKQLATFDAAVLRSTWNYTDHYAQFCAWLDELESHKVRLFNDIDTVRWNSDKIYLRELHQNGFKIVETRWIDRGEKYLLEDGLAELGCVKAVVKPRVSATAKGLFTTSPATASVDQEKLDTLLATQDVMLQPFVHEIVAQGEWSLVFFGTGFSHGLIKRAKAGDHRVQSDFGGTATPQVPSESLIRDAERLLRHISASSDHPPLYSRVDGIERNGRLILMELELIEPDLFFATDDAHAPARFENALCLLLAVEQGRASSLR